MVHKEGVIIAAFKPSNDFKIAIACLGTWVLSDMLCCLLKKCNALIAVQFSYLQELLSMLQFNVSSQAKNGGAYFLAVRGSVIDPIAVPGQFEVTRV